MAKWTSLLYIFFIGLHTSPGFSITPDSSSQSTFRYCIPVEKINLNPFREIKDGKDTAYLMLLKSYISEDPSNPGILDKYEFSPSGDFFTGRINTDLKWSDGSSLTVEEAALGIAKALYFRPLGDLLDAAAKNSNFDISIVPISAAREFDAKIQSSAIQDGRHIIFQDLLVTEGEAAFLKNALKTRKSLKEIAAKSAATIPPDNVLLQNFEKNAFDEKSVVPVGRRFLTAFYRKGLPIIPAWTPEGELYFKLSIPK